MTQGGKLGKEICSFTKKLLRKSTTVWKSPHQTAIRVTQRNNRMKRIKIKKKIWWQSWTGLSG